MRKSSVELIKLIATLRYAIRNTQPVHLKKHIATIKTIKKSIPWGGEGEKPKE